MPFQMTMLACLQALLLDYAPNRTLCIIAQASAPLFDTSMQWSRVPLRFIALQSVLHAATLLLPVYAIRMDSEHGGSAMNALIKALAPFLCLFLQWSSTKRQLISSGISCIGFLIASWPHSGEYTNEIVLAEALLFAGTLCGVILGLTQQRYGACWYEMSIGAALICATTVNWRAIYEIVLQDIAVAIAFGALSFYVQRVVRTYSASVENNALQLSMALNERRGFTIILSAFRCRSPMQILVGAVLVIGGVGMMSVKQQ